MNKFIASIGLALLLFTPAVADGERAAASQPVTHSQDVMNHCNGRVKGEAPVVKSASQMSHRSEKEPRFQKLRVVPAPTKSTIAKR